MLGLIFITVCAPVAIPEPRPSADHLPHQTKHIGLLLTPSAAQSRSPDICRWSVPSIPLGPGHVSGRC